MSHSNSKSPAQFTRRRFLQRGAGLGAIGLTGALGPMGKARSALPAAPASYTDYRALVCVFLSGGNDSFNLFVPNDAANYGIYADSRQNLAVPQADLLPVTPLSGGSFGFHPSCAGLRNQFMAGNLAVVANCGPLAAPTNHTTRNDFLSQTVPLPTALYSPSDQKRYWQAIDPSGASNRGWAGGVADMITPAIHAVLDPTAQAFNMNISLAGNNLMQAGATSTPYVVNSDSVALLTGLNTNNPTNARRLQAFNDLLSSAQTSSPLIQESGAVMERARDSVVSIEAALGSIAPFATQFPDTALGRQLETVARMIAIRATLSVQRQIFYVEMGGFDTHNAQLDRQPVLLAELSEALDSFLRSTMELGLQDNVVTFTNSEFGRALPSNGDGSDHGWGGHSLVMGGCVSGQDVYGTMPNLTIGGPDDSSGGRIIPTTPVDAFHATLCDWFGVTGLLGGGTVAPGSHMDQLFPSLSGSAFPFPPGTHNLGFMM